MNTIKKPRTAFLDDRHYSKLKAMAQSMDIEGRAWFTEFLRKIADHGILLMDTNFRKFLEEYSKQYNKEAVGKEEENSHERT